MRFTDKLVLVIGGNSGIGLASAQAFAEEGAIVRITGRNESTMASALETLPRAKGYAADMADASAMAQVIDRIEQEHGRIDVLFVNAGVGGFAGIRDITHESWDQVHSINLRGAVFAIQTALRLMAKGGSIVVTSSIGGQLSIPGNISYAASKGGLDAAMRTLAGELVREGIRLNIVSPGPIDTPLLHRNPNMSESEAEALKAVMIEQIPMGRMGLAEEVARAVLFLASDEASFITGANLNVDGGAVELR